MESGKKGNRVLVIDDDPDALESCKDALAQNGFAVTTCAESTQAIPTLKKTTYCAVLLDIRMPGIEGSDLLPLIKKICPDLPVVIVSAYCDPSKQNYYHSLGAFDVLSKPFSHEKLLDTVTCAVEEQEHVPITLMSLSLREGRDQVYRKLILFALRKTNWNQVKAAKLLGISRYCLMRWIRKLGISY